MTHSFPFPDRIPWPLLSRFRKYAKKRVLTRLFSKKALQTLLKTRYRALFWFLVVFCTVGCLQEMVRVVQNRGASLPQPYFLQIRHLPPRVGHYTLTWHDHLERKVIKQVIGKGGDRLWYDGNGFLWLNKRKIGKPYPKGSDGRPLTPISAGVIPQGTVFLYAPPDRSFDSRYQEFGLIPQTALQGRLIPLGKGEGKQP